MSTSASSRPPSPTRQQLDELDALLERMLALPVNKLDEEAALSDDVSSNIQQPREKTKRDEPTPAPATSRVALEQAPAVPSPLPSASAPPLPLGEGRGEGRFPEREKSERRRSLGRSLREDVSQRVPEPRRCSWWLWPLLLINAAFFACSDRLGAPGRWLRRPRGRAFLGIIGLLLLLAAVLLFLFDLIAWTW